MLNFLHSAVNELFAIICSAIYGIMILVYKLFYSISNTGLIEESYQILAKNVYTILGVLMIFKLAFSIIQYIIDPDQFSNKENGFSALIKNVFIVLVLILVVPIAFSQARRLQIIILSEDIVGRVITGKNMSSLSSTNKQNNAQVIGDKIAFNILSGFIRPNSDLAGCDDTLNMDDSTMVQCINSITTVDSAAGRQYQNALNSEKYTELLKSSIMFSTFKNSQGDKVLTFDFNGIFASICGGFTVYILFIFCIDIAVRSVKFSFLQMFAPIPIVSYIDPKSKKQLFDKWVKVSISTYLDLFIRLAAIYFAVYLIQIILATGLETTELDAAGNLVSSKPGVFVRIFMILGLLMFAKQLPNLIKDLTGLDLGGKFTLNPIKKIQDEALFGKQVGAGAAFVGRTAKNLGLAAGLAVGAPIGMGLKAAGAWAGKGISNKYNNFKGNHTGLFNKLGAAGSWIGARADYVKTWGEWTGASKHFNKIGADFAGTVGAGFTKNKDDQILAGHKKVNDAISNMENRALEKIKNGEAGELSREYNERQAILTALRGQDTRGMSDADLKAHAAKIAQEQLDFDKWYNNDAKYAYIDLNDKNATVYEMKDDQGNVIGTYNRSDVFDAGKDDAALTKMQETYDSATAANGFAHEATAAGRHKQQGVFKGEDTDITNKRMAQQEAKK